MVNVPFGKDIVVAVERSSEGVTVTMLNGIDDGPTSESTRARNNVMRAIKDRIENLAIGNVSVDAKRFNQAVDLSEHSETRRWDRVKLTIPEREPRRFESAATYAQRTQDDLSAALSSVSQTVHALSGDKGYVSGLDALMKAGAQRLASIINGIEQIREDHQNQAMSNVLEQVKQGLDARGFAGVNENTPGLLAAIAEVALEIKQSKTQPSLGAKQARKGLNRD
jgi:hypothetical protein